MTTDPGLCRSCDWSRRVQSDRGSTFWLCGAARSHPGMRKYPPLPVRDCRAWIPRVSGEEADEERHVDREPS
jgi:hypothetical protein